MDPFVVSPKSGDSVIERGELISRYALRARVIAERVSFRFTESAALAPRGILAFLALGMQIRSLHERVRQRIPINGRIATRFYIK